MRHTSMSSTGKLGAVAVGLAALACGDLTGVDPEDLVGTWRAYTAVATNAARTSETADLVANGVAITFVIEANGRVETIIAFDDIVDSDFGILEVSDGEFTLTIEGQPSTGTLRRKLHLLTINIITGVEWDFGNDGLDEPATLFLEMQRDQS